jgi:hypothetical protein
MLTRASMGAAPMTQLSKAISINAKFAQKTWGKLPQVALRGLEELTRSYSLSVASGDLSYLDGKWYVTHPGLLRVARRSRCAGIRVEPAQEFCDPKSSRWAFKATVYKSRNCKGFVGYGDADPSNVSLLVRGAEMRVAETRAVNRALRKAYGIGMCSVEELGSFSAPTPTSYPKQATPISANGNGSRNGEPRLRDQLCLLIRQFNLDPTLVKAYAADFCGTETLKDASRDLVESFISHVAKAAKEDRDALVCKLNSYAQPTETKP